MASPPRIACLSPPQLRLKSACRAAVKAVGGTSLAAEELGIRQQRVSDCQLVNCPDFLRLDEMLGLEEATRGSVGWPAITRASARIHGFELMPLPAAMDSVPSWHRSIAEVSREVADACGRISEALESDNDVTAAEVREGAIVDEIDEAIARLLVLRGRCMACLEGGNG